MAKWVSTGGLALTAFGVLIAFYLPERGSYFGSSEAIQREQYYLRLRTGTGAALVIIGTLLQICAVWLPTTASLLGFGALPSKAHELVGRCQQAANDEIATKKGPIALWAETYPRYPVQAAFSTVIDGCVVIAGNDLDNEWHIFDLNNSLVAKPVRSLFNCDRDGVDNAVIDKVRSFRGYVWDKEYKLWLDDGHGGPPRALKAPEKPYSRDRCRAELDAKADELGIPRWKQP